MAALSKTTLTPTERRLLGLLAHGQTLTQAAAALGLAPAEAESLLAALLHRHSLTTLHQLLARALVHRWI